MIFFTPAITAMVTKLEMSYRIAENIGGRKLWQIWWICSVRRFKDNCQDQLKKLIHNLSPDSPNIVREFVPKKRGQPLLIGEELDEQVREYIRELRREGVVINSDVAIAVGTGIIMNSNANLLVANSGHIDLTKHWEKYLLSRMGFVKRRVNTKAKVTVEYFDELKKLFSTRIQQCSWNGWDPFRISNKLGADGYKLHMINSSWQLYLHVPCQGIFFRYNWFTRGKLLGVYQSINFLQTGT